MSSEHDPLDLNLDTTNTDTSFPSLSAGTIPMRIVSYDIQKWASGKGRSLNFKLETIKEEESTKGNQVNPGFPVIYRLALQQAESDKAPDFMIALAKFSEAVFGEKRVIDSSFLAESIGQVINCNFKAAKKEQVDAGFAETEIKGASKYEE